jgi:hypothetical protein
MIIAVLILWDNIVISIQSVIFVHKIIIQNVLMIYPINHQY